MVKKIKTDASLGAAIDAIGKMKLALQPLEAKVAAGKKAITAAENKLLARVNKSKLNGAAGKIAEAKVDKDELPIMQDYDKFTKYVRKKNAFDLMQRRVSKEAWSLRRAEGITVPGIGVFNSVKLSVKLKKKKH